MKYLIIILLVFTFTLISCSKLLFDDDIKVVEKPLKQPFSVVDIRGIYNILLVQDSANKLVISGSNDINSIECSFKNDTLFIDNGKKISFNTKKNNLELHFSNFRHLITNNPVNITNTDTLRLENFTLWTIGELAEVNITLNSTNFAFANSANTLGHFYFKGKSDYLYIFNRYGCTVFADSFMCRHADIINESVGDVYINASERISVYIWGPGTIYYYNNPIIDTIETKSEGKIISIKVPIR